MKNSVILIVIDGLPAPLLGPYGNTWIPTQAINQLASQSIMAEQLIVDQLDPRKFLETITAGTSDEDHAAAPANEAPQVDHAEETWSLITDERRIAESMWAHRFAEVECLDLPAHDTCCQEVNETHLAQVFAALAAKLSLVESPYFVVVAARGLTGNWDAPYEYRQQFVSEDDPDPPHFTHPHLFPGVSVRADDGPIEPDDIFCVRAAAAAQIVLLDICLAAIREQLIAQAHQDSPTTLILTASRGYELGEHQQVGCDGPRLFAPAVHVPWICWNPVWPPSPLRRPELLQPDDLSGQLREVGGAAMNSETLESSSMLTNKDNKLLVVTRGEAGQYRLQTAAWAAVVHADAERCLDTPAAETDISLFAKPDDRWEINNVADRCPKVAEAFREYLRRYIEAGHTHPGSADTIPAILLERED